MLTIDESELASLISGGDVAKPPPTHHYTFACLTRPLRVEVLPVGEDNAVWLNMVLTEAMKRDTAKAAAEESGELDPASADFLAECLAGVESVARTRIAGWEVQEVDGSWARRAYTPELGMAFLRKLLEQPRGLGEYLAFVKGMAPPKDAATAPDPAATAGNSSAA